MSEFHENKVSITFQAIAENQSFARAVAASYIIGSDPTIEELTEIKTVVSEAVSNAIIHGYENKGKGEILMELSRPAPDKILIKVIDKGVGIGDIEKAMEPMFTTKSHLEMSGMGFTVMESFADKISVKSSLGMGTTVTLAKSLDKFYE